MTWPRLPPRTGISYPLQQGAGREQRDSALPGPPPRSPPTLAGTPARPAGPAPRPGGDTGNAVSGTRRTLRRPGSARSPTGPGAERAITASRRGNRGGRGGRCRVRAPRPAGSAARRPPPAAGIPARTHRLRHSRRLPGAAPARRSHHLPGPAPRRPRARHWAVRLGGGAARREPGHHWLPTPSLRASPPGAPPPGLRQAPGGAS